MRIIMYFRGARPERADASRNRDAIIEAALMTLNENPNATLGDIATAAGLSRGTLYGHFSGRRALVAAAFRWIMEEVDHQLAEIDPGVPAVESLEGLVATSWWVLGHFAGMAAAARTEIPESELRRLHDEPLSRIQVLLVRGRLEGVFRADQDLGWQTECFYAILQAGAAQIRAGRLLQPAAAAEMVTTIRALLATGPESSPAGSPELPPP